MEGFEEVGDNPGNIVMAPDETPRCVDHYLGDGWYTFHVQWKRERVCADDGTVLDTHSKFEEAKEGEASWGKSDVRDDKEWTNCNICPDIQRRRQFFKGSGWKLDEGTPNLTRTDAYWLDRVKDCLGEEEFESLRRRFARRGDWH